MRGRFFRRIGCLFFGFFVFMTTGFLLFLAMLFQILGVAQLPEALGWAAGLAVLVVFTSVILLVWGAHRLRHFSLPFGELLDASERISGGDFSVRVEERGPSEVRSLAHAFNSMAAQLQSDDEQRRSLLADVTHELRTPLAVIQGKVEGMLDGVYTADENHLRSILEETQLLARLTDDLRTLSLAQSGTLQLAREPTDLALLLAEIVASFQNQADKSGVTIQINQKEELPALMLDPQRMREVFGNLLENALRYTPAAGQIQVGSQIQPVDGKVWVVTTIQDSGPGIPAEALKRIFDRYYKGGESHGMGLGLAIARSLVEAHGGRIEVDSGLHAGTTVRVHLPAAVE